MEGLGETFEIVFVEDCGTDGSWKTLQALAEKDDRVWAIQLLPQLWPGKCYHVRSRALKRAIRDYHR